MEIKHDRFSTQGVRNEALGSDQRLLRSVREARPADCASIPSLSAIEHDAYLEIQDELI